VFSNKYDFDSLMENTVRTQYLSSLLNKGAKHLKSSNSNQMISKGYGKSQSMAQMDNLGTARTSRTVHSKFSRLNSGLTSRESSKYIKGYNASKLSEYKDKYQKERPVQEEYNFNIKSENRDILNSFKRKKKDQILINTHQDGKEQTKGKEKEQEKFGDKNKVKTPKINDYMSYKARGITSKSLGKSLIKNINVEEVSESQRKIDYLRSKYDNSYESNVKSSLGTSDSHYVSNFSNIDTFIKSRKGSSQKYIGQFRDYSKRRTPTNPLHTANNTANEANQNIKINNFL